MSFLGKIAKFLLSWALGKLLGTSAPDPAAVGQMEKDRADAADKTLSDIARARDAGDRVRDAAADIVRDPDNAG